MLKGSLHCLYFIYNVGLHLLTLWSRVRFKHPAKDPVQYVREGEGWPLVIGLQVGHDTWRDSARLELIGD